MYTNQSEELRVLNLDEMEETCGGDAACNTVSAIIGAMWGGAVAGSIGGPAGALAGAITAGVVSAVISSAAC